jgi:hypothetical protein
LTNYNPVEGTQGTAVALSLLQSKQNFVVRAITRNPKAPKAQALARLGAQVVKADGFNDYEMLAALSGAWGFWLNTHHHDPVSSYSETSFRRRTTKRTS